MSDIDELIAEEMRDPAFKEAWEASKLEDQLRRMLIAARIDGNLTQKELAEQSGVRQSNISRIESGRSIPTLSTLAALARGLGKRLKIQIV